MKRRIGFFPFLLLAVFALSLPTCGSADEFFGRFPWDHQWEATLPGDRVNAAVRSVTFFDGAKWIEENESTLKRTDFDYVESVHIDGVVTRQLMEFVCSLRRLKHLRISEPGEIDYGEVLAPISKARYLQTLHLETSLWGPQSCKFLADVPSLVDFSCDSVLSKEDFLSISRLPKLRQLNLSDPIDAGGEELALPNPAFPELVKLYMRSAHELKPFKNAPKLKQVWTWDVEAKDLPTIEQLQALEAIKCQVDSPETALKLMQIERIRKFDLQYHRD